MLQAQSILIVDADAYSALDLAEIIEESEGQVAGPVASVSDALAIIDSQDIAAAVVDCELGDALALIKRLAEDNVPLVIQAGAHFPKSLAFLGDRIVVLAKPVASHIVLDAILIELGKADLPSDRNKLGADVKEV